MQDDAGFWLPVLTEKALRARFGVPVLARSHGLAVGPCQAPSSSEAQGAARQVQARVQGSRQLYLSRLHLAPGSALRGACDCAQGALGRACKHQAALALAWRRQLAGTGAQTPDGAAACRLAVAALFDALFDTSPAEARPAQLQTLIPSLQAWRAQEPAWALAAAEQALPPLCERLTQLQAARGWGDGEADWRALAEAVVAELFAAWTQLSEQPAAYAERYLALLAADSHGLIDPRRALALLGPALAERAGALLRQRWESGGSAQDYLLHLTACDDEAERIRVLAAARSDAGSHAAYVQALLRAGQGRAALAAAEMAQRSFPQDRALEALLQARYEADGWDAEAQALRRRALLREPSRHSYQALLATGDAAAARTQLWAAVQSAGADLHLGSLRLWLCIDEARFDEGLAWLAAHPGFAEPALQVFLQSLPAERADEGNELLKRALEQALHQARPPFAAELALLRELLARLSPEAGRLYISWLRLQHRRRPELAMALKAL